ncbi:MAG TPA: hypothetical protein VMZ53_10905 [Kofleriaceae bacterium]|nr:hypothetical protein [Kofleriaceae bacterium]
MRRLFVISLLVVGSIAYADKPKARKPVRPVPQNAIVGRIVGLDIYTDEGRDSSVITVAAGSENGISKGWHARFREGTTSNRLSGGDATVIRIDRRTVVLKTDLPAEQVRANRYIEFSPR